MALTEESAGQIPTNYCGKVGMESKRGLLKMLVPVCWLNSPNILSVFSIAEAKAKDSLKQLSL